MYSSLAIVLTVRMDSARLPGKAMAEVAGKPLVYWVARRLQQAGQVILAITTGHDDDPLEGLASAMRIPVVRYPAGDTVSPLVAAMIQYAPTAKYILRGLGDCPFIATELVERACRMMQKQGKEAFLWALPPWALPVYGAREFPYSRTGLKKIDLYSHAREHLDLYFHTNRDKFEVVYHEPPPNVYFRRYRLEVDWPEDLMLVRKVAEGVNMLAPMKDIIKFLDQNPGIASLNRERVEKTGPSCYTYQEQRAWFDAMKGQPIVAWDDKVWLPPAEGKDPVFCTANTCLIGYSAEGVLYKMERDAGDWDRIAGDAWVACKCGAGRRWVGK